MPLTTFSMSKKNISIFILAFLVTAILASDAFTRSQNNAFADTEALVSTKKKEVVENLNAEIALFMGVAGLLGLAVKIVGSLHAVENRIKEQLRTVETNLHQDILTKHEGLGRELAGIKQDLFATQAQFQLSIVEVRQELLKVNHKFETAMVSSDSNYEILLQNHVNLQKEVQGILRQFHDRLSGLELFEVEKHQFKPSPKNINLDIESL